MFDFFNRLFGVQPSSQTAKERLRLVLLSDHLSLAPDVIESLKHDLIEVISRYVEVDAANCDVTFEQREKQVAMLANIPILGMQRRPAPPPSSPAPPAPPLGAAGANASVAAPSVHQNGVTITIDAPPPKPKAQRKSASAAPGAGGQTAPRRRRRKAVVPPGVPSPQPG